MVFLCILAGIYAAFLVWHEPWFSQRLKPGEAASLLHGKYEDMEETDPQERRAFEAFMDADDGRPFYMVNLMQYRDRAEYRNGLQPDRSSAAGMTGREAGRRYARVVVPELLKRGCYPVFVSRKIANFLSAGSGSDFFKKLPSSATAVEEICCRWQQASLFSKACRTSGRRSRERLSCRAGSCCCSTCEHWCR